MISVLKKICKLLTDCFFSVSVITVNWVTDNSFSLISSRMQQLSSLNNMVCRSVASIPPKFEVEIGCKFSPLLGSLTFAFNPPAFQASLLPCVPSMALSTPFSSPFSLLRFPLLYRPFPLCYLLPLSFLFLLFLEGPHTKLRKTL